MALPKQIHSHQSEAERAKWKVVRLDTYTELPGTIVEADVDTGEVKLVRRGPDQKADDGTIVKTWLNDSYSLGPGAIAIVRRR